MRKIYITLGLLAALNGYAQNKDTQKADKLFESYQYVGAAEEYLKLVDKKKADGYVYKQLADSYYNVFNTAEATRWYAKAVESNQDAEVYYRYAQMLKTQGKYAEANKQMDKFASLLPNDKRAIEHKANPNYIPSLESAQKMYDVKQTNINSKNNADFGATLTNDGILYFVSSRNASRKTDKWDGQPYLDIYQSVYDASGVLSSPTEVSELNTRFHDGPVAVSADGKTIFFARDGHSEGEYEKDKKNNVKVSQLGLYKATRKGDKWENVKALPFNSTEYSVSSPALSKDGKTLYFASNMPGGLGDTDIWKVEIKGDGYGTPVNLGPEVNTPGKENFPFVTEDNVLFFSSNGKQGFGGLDVFKLDLNKAGAKATNVGKPVNSEKDDFSFSFNTQRNIGFFSSNRAGSDNIYTATPVCGVEAIAVVKDAKTGKILANAKVAILDEKKNIIATEQTNANGEVTYNVDCNKPYIFQGSKQDYESTSVNLAASKGGKSTTEILLQPIEVVITETHVVLNDIYFEFDKSNITEQGAKELDKLVKVLNDHPTMVIMVKSHTDTKGSDNYNKNLSERRAQSTVQYVISKGIAKDRISGKGFGESEPKVDCKDNCTEEQDAQNRRSEFVIVKK